MIILTSGVVASIISSIFGFITSNRSNKLVKSIEEFKANNEIQTFRYTSLYSINSELNQLSDIDYTMLEKKNNKLVSSEELTEKVVSAQTEQYGKLKKIYFKAKPLFNQSKLVEVEKLIDLEKNESNLMVDFLYGNSKVNGDLNKILLLREKIKVCLQNAIINQLQDLTQKSKTLEG